jgi:hypothetical protein
MLLKTMGCPMLKTHIKLLFSSFFFLMPLTVAMAGWQVSQPGTMTPREPFFQSPSSRAYPGGGGYAFPNQYASLGQPVPIYAVSISGSVKENLERIMGRYHWKVVWKAPYDYNFDGRVTGSSLPNVVEKLLQPFPLQAVMYMSNRTMAIVPRNNTPVYPNTDKA